MSSMEFNINSEIDLIAYRNCLFINNRFGQSEANKEEVIMMRDALNRILEWWNE